jgi:hypothetical protein
LRALVDKKDDLAQSRLLNLNTGSKKYPLLIIALSISNGLIGLKR